MKKIICLSSFVVAVGLISIRASAQLSPRTGVENFESHPGPTLFNNPPNHPLPKLNAGPLTFSGGQTLTNSTPFGSGTVYGTAGVVLLPPPPTACAKKSLCEGCSNGIEVTATEPFVSLSFDLIQANVPIFAGPHIKYTITNVEDSTQTQDVILTYGIEGARNRVEIPWTTSHIEIKADDLINTFPGCQPNVGTLYYFGIDNVNWELGRPRRIVTAGGTGPQNKFGSEVTGTITGDTADVTYPLGLPFYVRVEAQADDGTWQPVTSSLFTINDPDYPAPFQKLSKQLFGFNHIWAYDTFTPSQYKTFQTVHTGDVTITVEPQDSDSSLGSVQPFDVDLHIVTPDSLGATGPDGNPPFPGTFDKWISELADESGIPPQYLKAQVVGENPLFDGLKWIYHPIYIDYVILHTFNGRDLLTSDPYRDYALLEPGHQAEGSLLCPNKPVTEGEPGHDCKFGAPVDDIASRYFLQYMGPGNVRQYITAASDSDIPVTIRQIFNAGTQTFVDPMDSSSLDPSPGYGPTSFRRVLALERPRPAPHPSLDLLGGTAQTPLAGTYGLLQVNPVQAKESANWNGVVPPGGGSPRFNPGLLFDDPDVYANPNYTQGSLIPGINVDIDKFPQNHSKPFYDAPDQYEAALISMFESYKNGAPAAYGTTIVQTDALSCLPTSKSPVFHVAPNGNCAPIIVSVTDDATVTPGSPVLLGVGLAAPANVSRYQWYQGASGNVSMPVPNSDTQFLTVTPSASTSYWVAVTNQCGTSMSSAISVTVAAPCPVVTVVDSPMGGAIASGASLTLHVTASNAASYQWYIGEGAAIPGMDGDRSSPIPSSNMPDLLVQPVATTKYWVLATNGCGAAASTTAVVAVDCTPPSVDVSPQSSDISSGGSAVLSVVASGTSPLTIQWFTLDGVPAGDGGTISVSPTARTTYFARISNACGSVDSNPAVITPPCTPPSITSQPSGTVITGGRTATLSLSTLGSEPLTIQWLTTDGAIAGNGANIVVAPIVTTTYHANVANACGTLDSTPVTVTVVPCATPVITTQPASSTILPGQPTTLTVATNWPDATFQWFLGAAGMTTSPIAGATAASYRAAPSSTTSYWVRVTASCGPSVDSDTATLTVCAPTSSILISGVRSIVQGQSTMLTASATGTNVVYQWYAGDLGVTTNPIFVGAQSININPQYTSSYWVRATGSCGSSTVAAALVTVCAIPTIDIPPGNVSIQPGTTATLTVAASDLTATPLTYQWFLGNSGDVSTPVGNGAVFTTPALTADTSYWVRVWCDICGPTDSDTVTVSICALGGTITGAPDLSISPGQTAHLTLPPFSPPTGNTFFWYQGASGDTSHPLGDFTGDWGPYNYIDVSPLVTTQYWALIKNGSCVANTTTTTVSVCIPTITQQPAGIMINGGQSTTLTVVANTPGLTYQWYTGASGNTSSPISGQTAASYTASPAVTTSYWVRVTGSCGQSVDSNTAIVTICQPPSAVTVSGGGSIVRGQSATLFASSTGTGITYQWYMGTAGNTTTPIYNGAQSITVTPQDQTNYWVRVTGECGTRDSATVAVNVCAVPTITAQPQSVSIFSGGTATLSVAATVATATPLTYQWYVGASGTMTSPISGATSSSYTTPALTTDTSYWVAVSSDICGPTQSDAATVSMCPLSPTMTGAPNLSIAFGQTAHLVIPPFSPPTGNTFFWYQGASGDTSHPLGDFGGDWGPYNYLDVSPAVTTQYWAQIKNGTCVSSTGTTTVSVCIPTITQQPAGLMINSGQTTTLTVAANTAGLTYQWYRGASGDTSTSVGTNSSSFTTPALTVATSYWVRVTGTCGQSVNSNTATVTICQIPVITTQPAGTSLVRGQSTTLGVSATGTGLSYQWYIGTSGNTSSPVAGNSNLYTVTAPQNPVDYWVKVTGTCGTAVNSNTAHISVCTTPTITTQPQSLSIFSGASATLSVSASEATGETLHYQWHRGTTSPVNVGTDSPTYNTGALSADTSYFVTITGGAAGLCSVDSAAATVSICMYPQSVPGAPNANTSPGQTVRLTIPSNPGVTSYLWYRGASGDTSNPMGGWQAANYVDVAPTTTTSYWAQWQANSGACISNTTTTTVSVCIPVITQQPGSVTIASGSTTLSVVSNLPGSTYQWYVGASGTTTSPISGATAASVTVTPGATTSYWCKVSGSCGTANSNTATVTICSPPVITHQPANSVASSGQMNVLTVTATGTNLTYQWYMGASGDTSNLMSGRTTSTLQNNPTSSVQYWVKVSGTCGSVNSSAAWMSVPPGIISQPQQTTYASSGSKGNLFVNAVGTGLHYQWWGDSGPVSGAPDSPNLITPNITATASFYCLITSSGGAQTTSWSGTFYLCDGVAIYPTTVTNAGGNCRYLIANAAGPDAIYWYQGQRGDTSIQVGTSGVLYVCPTSSTTYWYRATNTDQNQQVSCYADSAATTVP